MRREDHHDSVQWDRALGSFTTAAGLALGEFLVLAGRPEELLEHLRSIHIVARATILSSDAQTTHEGKQGGMSLAVAALGVVSAWHAEPQDLRAVGEAMALLEEVLEEMGALRVLSNRSTEEK